jgi:glycosyltransferase involved in cell wall biosynthesis
MVVWVSCPPNLRPVTRLAVVVSHPIQYYSPWFRLLASEPGLQLKVFHLWDFGVVSRPDRGFGHTLVWDVPLLEGFPHCFVPNRAADPGTHHFAGLHNPTLVQELLVWRPDALLLFGYAYRSHLGLLLDPRLWRLPVLFRGDSHGLCARSGWRPRLAAGLRRLVFRRFAAALAVGQANAAWLRASGISPRRIVLAPHAVDNQRFQEAAPTANLEAEDWRQTLGIATEAPVVLFAGKFEAKKCPLQLVDAFAALNHPHAVLVLAGAGALEERIRSHAATLPAGRVLMLPFQNQSAMPRLYALADLVVLPSQGPGETWGLCINEAMNLARPVLVSSHVGCGPDLVLPGRTGWIVPAGDQNALRDRLAEALSDRQRLRAMGEQARAHVATHSYAATTAGLLQALELVGARR